MLKQQLQTDMKSAMRQKDQQTLDVLRMALSSISAKEKEKRYKIAKEKPEAQEASLIEESQLSEEQIIDVLASEVKKRKDAIALYQEGGRPELAQKEEQEIAILQKYLPEQLTKEELTSLIKAAIEKTGASQVKDMGKVMSELMPQVKGKADNKEISEIIKQILTQ